MVLSAALAKEWLTPEEYPKLVGALHAPSAHHILLERIEQRIHELDEAEQKRRWFHQWSYFARVRPRQHNEPCWEELRAEFERAS